ncbi:WD repeat-containing protein 55 homolog isoform X1 [Musca domestica]|uniref:WD repeat-containing protein 55 homolog n=2 Tax=Musca domestica TaxID=7370 RepID=A0A9J7CLI6_MUSDO|nr:WD repeat-containing protein 55 homolog isoform X1 [Musca domestica]
MRMRSNFKNPDDPSDGSEIDEVTDAVLEDDVELMINARVEDWSEDDEDVVEAAEGNAEYDIGDEDTNSDDSSEFDPMATDSDDSMSDGEAAGGSKAENKTNSSATPGGSKGNEDEGGGGGGSSKAVLELNEDEEDDETVKAIIAAIKKPRSSPPEIKLEDFVTDICFHPLRDIIAIATITGDVALYEYSNEGNKHLRTIEVHAKACRDVEFSTDGLNVLTCSKDKSIMITDMETEKLKKFYESAHEEPINKLHVIDENLFATGDDGGTVKLWDLRTKNEIFALKEVEDYVTQMLTNEAGKLLLVTSGDGYLTTLNIGARKLYVQSEPYEEELTCMGTYRGDSKLVVGTSKGNLYTFNWGQFGYHSDKFPGVKSSMSEMIPITDRIACVAGEEGIIRAVHIAPFRNLGIVGQHSMPIESLDVSNSGELIASSSHNNDVRFWNVKYFEEFGDIKYNEKHNSYKEKRHNLPSSKFSNASDFFSDLAKEGEENNGDE